LLLNGTGLMWLFATLLPQQSSPSQQALSRVQPVISAFCEVTQGFGNTYPFVPTPNTQTLLRSIWSRSKRARFAVEVDFQLTFDFLLVLMEDCQHRCCRAEVELLGLEVFTYSRHVSAEHSFHCLPVTISMHNC